MEYSAARSATGLNAQISELSHSTAESIGERIFVASFLALPRLVGAVFYARLLATKIFDVEYLFSGLGPAFAAGHILQLLLDHRQTIVALKGRGILDAADHGPKLLRVFPLG